MHTRVPLTLQTPSPDGSQLSDEAHESARHGQWRVGMHGRKGDIDFEKFGQGFPILTFAPAGLRSAIIDVRNGFSVPVTPQAGRRAGFVEPCRR